MHILYFSRDYSSHDFRFLTALNEAGYQVSYLRLERHPFALEKRSLSSQINVIDWKGGKAPAHLGNGLVLLADLQRVLHRLNPDLVLAGPVQRSAFLTALSGFKPLITMSWGYDLLQEAAKNSAWGWATRFTLQHSAAFIGDCETIRQRAISYGMPDEKIVIFPWGVDLDHFSPKHLDNQHPAQPGAPFTLISTRNWEPVYGVDTIARAFVIAAAERPGIRMIMLGNGSQIDKIQQIFSDGGVITFSQPTDWQRSGEVHFPGVIGFSDLPDCYRSADLYISATYSDGSSISLLEAMACGLPVLVSDIPGNREWVQPEVNGWLAPAGNPEAFAQKIIHAIDKRDLLQKMGTVSREIAEQRADWKSNFLQLHRAFEIALNHS